MFHPVQKLTRMGLMQNEHYICDVLRQHVVHPTWEMLQLTALQHGTESLKHRFQPKH